MNETRNESKGLGNLKFTVTRWNNCKSVPNINTPFKGVKGADIEIQSTVCRDRDTYPIEAREGDKNLDMMPDETLNCRRLQTATTMF